MGPWAGTRAMSTVHITCARRVRVSATITMSVRVSATVKVSLVI